MEAILTNMQGDTSINAHSSILYNTKKKNKLEIKCPREGKWMNCSVFNQPNIVNLN